MIREISKDEFINKNNINKYKRTWKHTIESQFFEFFLYILNNQKPNNIMDTLCIMIELCQLLTFPLSARFAPIWKDDSIYQSLSRYFQYFLFIPIFKESVDIYLIVFYIVFICIMGICGLFLYASSRIAKNQNMTQLWIFHILSFTLSLFGNVIYLPMLETMLSIFYCGSNDINKYSSNITCWKGGHFAHTTFAVIGVFFLVTNTLFYLYICFDIRKKTMSNNSKKTSTGDIALIIIKTYLSMVNAIFNAVNFNLIVIFISFLASIYLMYLYWIIRPYHSLLLTKLYKLSTFVLFWGFALLFAGTLLLNTSYDGGLPLLFIGIALVGIIILIPGERFDFNILFLKSGNISSGELFKSKLIELEALCDSEEHDRENEIIVRSYIQKYEETCQIPHCFLKQYLRTSQRILLYYHIESLYQTAISMYPYCASLRLLYVVLLLDKLNKIRKAKGELEKITLLQNIKLNDLFASYHLNKIIEVRLLEGNVLNGDHTSDLAFIRYKSLSSAFKGLITKAAALYLEFWNLLLISRNEIQEDLTKLNEIGGRINILVEEIASKIETLQRIKKNDEDIIRLYSEFLSEILNKNDLAQEYKKQLVSHNDDNYNEDNNKFDEGELLEDDFISLTTKKDRMFIIISAQNESFCNVTHMSLGISSRLGYSREELIGQPLDILLPEIYRKYHKDLLMNKSNQNKQSLLVEEEVTTSKSKTVNTFILTKSKYIFPISFTVILLHNENGKQFFIAKISSNLFTTVQYENNTMSIEDTCYVLTDQFLRIKNFTSNAVRLLGLGSLEMNGSYELTAYIKEFNEEYLKGILLNNKNDNSPSRNTSNTTLLIQSKIEEANLNSTRINLAKSYFEIPIKVTWKPMAPVNNHYSDQKLNNSLKDIGMMQNLKRGGDIGLDLIVPNKRLEMSFYVSIIEQKIGSHHIGYIFKFETINPDTIKHKTNSSFHKQKSSQSVIPQMTRKTSLNQLGFITEKKIICPDTILNKEKSQIDNPTDFLMMRNKSVLEKLKLYPNNSFQTNAQHNITFDKTFLPQISSKFIIDPSKNVFKEMKTSDAGVQLREILRLKAVERFELAKKITTETTSSIVESSSGMSNSNSSEIENTDSLVSMHFNRQATFKDRTLQSEYWENYYHVNIEKIKLQLYDFKKKMPVDMISTEVNNHQSEVERKLSQTQFQLESSINIDSSSMIITKDIKQKKNSHNNKKIQSSSSLQFLFKNTTESSESKDFLMQQIDFALKKKETQISIILFQFISFLSLAVIIIEASVFIQLALSNQLTVKNNMGLVVAAGEIIIASVHCTYHVRELTLLTDENYTFLYQEKEEYIMNHTLTLFVKFNQFSALQNAISANPLSLGNEKYRELYNKTVPLLTIDDKFQANFITVSIYSAFILLQLSLFKLTQTGFDLLIPSNKDAYFYISNSNNMNIINQREQIQIFYEMIEKTSKNHKNSMMIFIFVVLAMHIIFFFLMKHFYNNVVQKKDSYLKVFLDIGQLVIARSYEKCDKFLNKIQVKENHNDKLIGGDNASSEFRDEDMSIMEFAIDKRVTNEQKITKTRKGSSRISNESKLLNILFFIIFFIAFALLLAIVLYYWQFLNRIITLTKLLEIQLSIQIMTMMAFNIVREYIFDSNSYVYLQPIKLYTEAILSNYSYIIKQQQESFEREMSSLSPEFQMNYYQLHSKNICHFATDFFDTYFSGFDCDSLTNNVPSNGLKTTLSFFFEELREMKSIGDLFNLRIKHNNFRYNFTYLNTPKGDSDWPIDTSKHHLYFESLPVHIFNNQDYLILAFMFRFIIQPAFSFLMQNCYLAIAYEAEGTEEILTIGAIVYLCVFIIFYIIIWKPFELRLNNTIYKSKNMLTIIPKEVLASINNIHLLLDIEKSDMILESNDKLD